MYTCTVIWLFVHLYRNRFQKVCTLITQSFQFINSMSASKSNLIWAAHKNLRSACFFLSLFRPESLWLIFLFMNLIQVYDFIELQCFQPYTDIFIFKYKMQNLEKRSHAFSLRFLINWGKGIMHTSFNLHVTFITL